MVRIAILSEDPAEGTILRRLLGSVRGFRVAAVLGQADGMERFLEEVRPDVAVVCRPRADAPLMDVVPTAARMAKVIVAAPLKGGRDVLDLLTAGASGVLRRASMTERISAAVECVAGGGVFVDGALGTCFRHVPDGGAWRLAWRRLKREYAACPAADGRNKSIRRIMSELGVDKEQAGFVRRGEHENLGKDALAGLARRVGVVW